LNIARLLLVAIAVVLPACAGVPWQESTPATPEPVVKPQAAATPVSVSPLTDEPADPLPTGVTSERALADSAADARALEQLATVLAPGSDLTDSSLQPFGAGDAALDLTTYAGDPRIQFYLDFFKGAARPRMEVWLQRLPVYESMVRKRFEAEGLPSDLVYLGLIESGYSNVAVSRSRAVGMWQFMSPTARWMGLRVDRWVDERRDPVKATDAAARYLSYLTKQFGSTYLAAAAYNAGPGTVSRGLKRVTSSNGGPESLSGEEEGEVWSDADFFTLADTRYLRSETKSYIPKLIAASLIARDPNAFGFEPAPPLAPFPTDSFVVPDMTGLDVMAELAGTSLDVLRALNPHYLRQTTPPGTTAVVRLPTGTAERVAAGYEELPPSKRVRYREHIVRKGETLGGIASRYRVSVSDLRSTNRAVRNTNLIRINQILVIPVIGGSGSTTGSTSRTPAVSPTGARVHVVRRGETASEIAERYGVGLSKLLSWNSLPRSGSIHVGQRLVLQPTSGKHESTAATGSAQSHLVRRGDTLSAIASRYGVSVGRIMELNGIRSARGLQAGKRIRIPS
jgi:membrane-bound lytic murein transglycosylase D